jgi:spermidine synthase
MGSVDSAGMKFPASGSRPLSPLPNLVRHILFIRRRFQFAILVLGLSGMVAQVLLLRELLVIFHGNELTIGIILGNWLVLEAIGSFFLGKQIEKIRPKLEAFVAAQLLVSVLFPVMIYLTRIFKGIIGVTVGEGLGLLSIFYSSFIILLPVSLLHGAAFTFACKIHSEITQKKAVSVGRVYVYETLGVLMGGVVFTYLLIPYFHSFEISFGLGLLNSVVCLGLLGTFWQRGERSFRKFLAGASLAFLGIFLFSLISPAADRLHHFSLSQQWQVGKIEHYQNSIYGNIVVVKKGEQYTFFFDGIPIITTPLPDVAQTEDFAHLSLLSHPEPREILVISGGAGGVINEILKHQIKRVDYAELDPVLLQAVQKFPTPLTQRELSHPRVNIKYVDGRYFVKKTHHKYDVVLIGISEFSNLQVNRLATEEFFTMVRRILKEKGILVISAPGSLTYLNEELINLNLSILNTLKKVYPSVKIIPGDLNLFLASISPQILEVDSSLLIKRLGEREFETLSLTPYYIQYRLDSRWRDWFLNSLVSGRETTANNETKINKDFHPLGTFYSLAFWNALFSPWGQRLFSWFERMSLRFFFIALSIFGLLFLLFGYKNVRLRKGAIPFAIISTGFAGMMFSLILIFAFQVVYGYLYYWIGLLTSIFMAGIGVGGLFMTRSLEKVKKDLFYLSKLEVSIIILSLFLPAVFLGPGPSFGEFFSQAIFLILCFIPGLLIGAEFPLANKIHLKTSPNLSGTAGMLYAGDLIGGWLGGLIGGVGLLLILGLWKTCLIIAYLKIISLIILLVLGKRCK